MITLVLLPSRVVTIDEYSIFGAVSQHCLDLISCPTLLSTRMVGTRYCPDSRGE